MEDKIFLIKGIHPGIIVDRELKRRNIKKTIFAREIGEHPQTFVSITKGTRKMNTGLSLKIENKLGWEEGFLMTLQSYYDINEFKKKENSLKKPDISKFRSILFWDTSIDKIDWLKHKESIIKRVFERGNISEKKEILKFYGKPEISKVLY